MVDCDECRPFLVRIYAANRLRSLDLANEAISTYLLRVREFVALFDRVYAGDSRQLLRIVLLGSIASITVVLGGSLAGAATAGETTSFWSVPTVPVRLSFPLLPALVCFYGGMVLLARSWLQLRGLHIRSGLRPKAVLVLILLWIIPFLVGPPLGSRDVYAYAAQGRAAEQGFDVYEAGPAVLGEQDPVLVPVDPIYYDAPVVYGPAFVGISKILARVSGDGVITSVVFFRLLALGGLALSAFSIFRIASLLGRDPLDALIIAIANPLTLLHLVSGAHNESIMVSLMLLGVAVGLHPRFRPVGIALCAVAAAIKLPALLGAGFLAVPWVLDTTRQRVRIGRAVSASLIVLGVFALAGELTGFGWSWVGAIFEANAVDAYLSVTTVTGFAISWLTGADIDPVLAVTRSVGYLVAISATLYLLVTRHRMWPEALGWSLFVAALFHPTTQPWYLTWSLGLLAAAYGGRRNRLLTAVCTVAAFSVLPSGPKLGYLLMDRAGVLSILFGGLVVLLLTLSPRAANYREQRWRSSPPIKGSSPTSRAKLDEGLVSVVVPVDRQSDKLLALLRRVHFALRGRPHELIVVDDTGGQVVIEDFDAATPDLVTVQTLRRYDGSRWGGSGGAISDGLAVANGALVIVVDGDLQDKAGTVVTLLEQLDDGHDVAVASRRLSSMDSGREQQPLSLLGLTLCRLLFPSRTRATSDPLSGFFAFRLDRVNTTELHPDGPKLLLELLVTHPHLQLSEVARVDVGRSRKGSRLSISKRLQILGHMLELWLRTSRLWADAPLTERVVSSIDEQSSDHAALL